MKSLARSLHGLLLMSSMLVAPSVALAQTAEPVQAQAEEETYDEGEIVVLGRNIPEPMRATSEVVTVLSAADLARTGDDNAAAALTRLSGLSVVSGRFVFVRGLGDRYSSALLNGSPLPSPEPLRRQVPLDLFPSNILDGATVQKTFSPNYPGEFGGGVIALRTLRLPTESFLTLKAGAGYNSESTNEAGFFYYGTGDDWTGFGGSARNIPGPLAEAMARNVRISGAAFTDAELETIGESLVNSPFTVVQTGKLDPDFEGELTAGASFDFGRFNLGLIGVAGYDSSWRTQRAERTLVSGGSIVTQGQSERSAWDIVFNMFGSASLGLDENEITILGLLVRSTTKEAQVYNYTDVNVDPLGITSLRSESTAWYERQLAMGQISGAHRFGALDVNWRGAFAQSTRDAPYERDVTYSVTGGVAAYTRDNLNRTRFSYLTDEVASGGVDVSYTLPLSAQRDAVLSAGVAVSNNVRWYELYTFVFTGPVTPAPMDVLQARVDYLFSPDNIHPQRFVLNEFTGRDDAYKARLTLNAYYASADVEILPLLRAAIGVRYEDASQLVRTGNRFGLVPFAAPVALENSYWLPAATLTWNFAEDLQLRLGYSQTVARPQFRELAFTPYLDPESGREYQGNFRLTDSEFQNFDVRLEYYFGRNQFITAAGFYKQIDRPIEEVVLSTGGGNRTLTNFINAPEAELYGVELEYRQNFSLPFTPPLLRDADWLFGANYTYTHSEVIAGAGATVIDPSDPTNPIERPASVFGLDGSPLQGTPEHIANLLFGYETEYAQLTLLIGYVSERIAQRGLGAQPVVYEDPGINVDLVYRRNFEIGDTRFTLSLSGRNLLDEDQEQYQDSGGALGRTEVNTYPRGRSFSASVTARF